MRGEYAPEYKAASDPLELPPRARRIQLILSVAPAFGELPPRARRIHTSTIDVSACCGTTSACAENTCGDETPAATLGNYLRVRGEYPPWSATTGARMELPPRARRIPHTVRNQNGQGGTTSACAENTGLDSMLQGLQGNYLRVRGEYATCGTLQALSPELPPRARRIR